MANKKLQALGKAAEKALEKESAPTAFKTNEPFDLMKSVKIKKAPKVYANKNANIEYYTDEKGNMRRRKIKK